MAYSATTLRALEIATGVKGVAEELLNSLPDKDAATTWTGTQTFADVVATNIDAGASGTAGTVDVFPATASKGKLSITCTDQAGNTTVTLNAAEMAAARTITIPDPGGAADLVVTAGAQTISGVKTFSAMPIESAGAVYATADKTYQTDTALAVVTGMSVTLAASGIYAFHAVLRVTATANGGIKVALGGTATATGVIATGINYNTTTLNVSEVVTALDTAFADATAACTHVVIDGTIEVNAGGTFTIDAAQNASHADTTTVHKYSHLVVTRIA